LPIVPLAGSKNIYYITLFHLYHSARERRVQLSFERIDLILSYSAGFIAVDWGTTNYRAYLVNPAGYCLAQFTHTKRVLSVAEGGSPKSIAEIRRRLGNRRLPMAGMIGSNRDWIETPCVR
jgi:hypothetical protein